jgi:hypothetical protein
VDQQVQRGVSTEKLLADLAQDFLIQDQAQAQAEAPDVKDRRKARKQSRREERQHARDLIAAQGMAVLETDEWPRGEGYAVEARRARQLAEYEVAEGDIPAILAQDENGRCWARRIRRLAVAYADRYAETLNVASAAGAVEALDIREVLEGLADQWLTSAELAQALNESSLTIPAKYTAKQASEWARTFFEVEDRRTKENGKQVSQLRIRCSIQTSILPTTQLDSAPTAELADPAVPF